MRGEGLQKQKRFIFFDPQRIAPIALNHITGFREQVPTHTIQQEGVLILRGVQWRAVLKLTMPWTADHSPAEAHSYTRAYSVRFGNSQCLTVWINPMKQRTPPFSN